MKLNIFNNPAYLVMSLMLGGIFIAGIYLFGNTAGEQVSRAIESGDPSAIHLNKLANPETYFKDAQHKFDNNSTKSFEKESTGRFN